MKVRKLISVSAGTLLLVTSITPILADEVSVMNTDMVTQICQDQIKESSNIIHQYLDGIQIEKEETVQAPIVNNEITYVYVEQPVYEHRGHPLQLYRRPRRQPGTARHLARRL